MLGTSGPPNRTALERAALRHLDRYAASEAGLRRVLIRAVRRRSGPGEPDADILRLVDAVVAATVRSGLVDDSRFADMNVSGLMRRGTSVPRMRARLAAKGVPAELAGAAIREAEPDELALARRHAERKRLGPFRPHPDPARHDRDLAALCRAGFSLAAGRAALATADGSDAPDVAEEAETAIARHSPSGRPRTGLRRSAPLRARRSLPGEGDG